MLNLIQSDKEVIVNGVKYESVSKALEALRNHSGAIEIKLNSKETTQKKTAPKKEKEKNEKAIFKIVVRQYMIKEATPEFDFHTKYNDNKPMPSRTMFGEILEETKGMFKMRLHCRAEKNSVRCSHCMRELTHPVSRVFGVGPLCGGHFWQADGWIKELADNEELLFKEADRKMREIMWTGWIPKKAIETMYEVES